MQHQQVKTNHAANRVAFLLAVKKTISRIWGIKSIFVESSASTIALVLHPYGMAMLDVSPQNPLHRGKSWPCLYFLSYVLIAAITPCLTGARFPQAFSHCSCESKRFWFPPQPPYQKRVQLLLGASQCHLRTNLAQVPSSLGSWQMSTAVEAAGAGRISTCSTCCTLG